MSRIAFAYSYYDYEGWRAGEDHYVGALAGAAEWAIAQVGESSKNVEICLLRDNQFELVLHTFMGAVQCQDNPMYACMATFLGHEGRKQFLHYVPTDRKVIESQYVRISPRIDEMEKLTVEEVVGRYL